MYSCYPSRASPTAIATDHICGVFFAAADAAVRSMNAWIDVSFEKQTNHEFISIYDGLGTSVAMHSITFNGTTAGAVDASPSPSRSPEGEEHTSESLQLTL